MKEETSTQNNDTMLRKNFLHIILLSLSITSSQAYPNPQNDSLNTTDFNEIHLNRRATTSEEREARANALYQRWIDSQQVSLNGIRFEKPSVSPDGRRDYRDKFIGLRFRNAQSDPADPTFGIPAYRPTPAEITDIEDLIGHADADHFLIPKSTGQGDQQQQQRDQAAIDVIRTQLRPGDDGRASIALDGVSFIMWPPTRLGRMTMFWPTHWYATALELLIRVGPVAPGGGYYQFVEGLSGDPTYPTVDWVGTFTYQGSVEHALQASVGLESLKGAGQYGNTRKRKNVDDDGSDERKNARMEDDSDDSDDDGNDGSGDDMVGR